MASQVAVPSMRGIGHAFKKFGWGVGGGLLFVLLYQLFGGLGIIAAPIIAGAVFKGDEGDDIAFMSGFLMLALGAMAGGTSGGTQTSTGSAI
jgi:hypothetical protein